MHPNTPCPFCRTAFKCLTNVDEKGGPAGSALGSFGHAGRGMVDTLATFSGDAGLSAEAKGYANGLDILEQTKCTLRKPASKVIGTM